MGLSTFHEFLGGKGMLGVSICHHFEFDILNLYVLSMCFVRYRSWIVYTVYNAAPMLFFLDLANFG